MSVKPSFLEIHSQRLEFESNLVCKTLHYQWRVCHYDISLYEINNTLECLVVNIFLQKVWTVPFAKDEHPLHEQIAYLKKCEPIVNDDGSIDFAKPILCWARGGGWDLHKPGDDKGNEIKLLRIKDRLVWQMYGVRNPGIRVDVRSQSFTPMFTVLVKVSAQNPSSFEFSDYTCSEFDRIEKSSIEEKINLIRDCTIHDLAVKCGGYQSDWNGPEDSMHPIIRVRPIYQNSIIDKRVLVSRFLWAVTLICYKGSEGNHAEIVIEGIQLGNYFLKICHFTGRPGREIEEIDISPTATFKYENRTQIWKIENDRVRKMIEVIRREKTAPPRLNEWGSDSIFGNGSHSCFTWAREKLEILGIVLGKSRFGFILTRSKNFTYPAHTEELNKQIPLPENYKDI